MRASLWIIVVLASLAGCRGELGAPCEDDSECRRGLRCIDHDAYLGAQGGQCSRSCSGDDECGDGSWCYVGACTKGCMSDADCPEGTLCNDVGELAECARVCESDEECAEAGNWTCPVPGELCVP